MHAPYLLCIIAVFTLASLPSPARKPLPSPTQAELLVFIMNSTLASSTMRSAVSMSAAASTYTWQMPSAWPSTGMRVLRLMCDTSALEPLGEWEQGAGVCIREAR